MELTSADVSGFKAKRRSGDSIIGRLLSPRPEFDLVQNNSVQRIELEEYIARKFDDAYQAHIHEFMPRLLSMRCLGHLSGVVGLRSAYKEKLFLEQYLDFTIEQELEEILQQKVTRSSVVEIGNLAVSKSGASQIVFLMLCAILHKAGYTWLVFSATQPLLSTFNKLGFKTQSIKQADPKRLQNSNQNEWGSYYQSNPVVAVGRLEDAMSVIQQRPLFRRVMRSYQERITLLSEEFKRAV